MNSCLIKVRSIFLVGLALVMGAVACQNPPVDGDVNHEEINFQDIEWFLTGVTQNDMVEAPVSGHIPTVRFTSDGIVGGTTGCNNYFGEYRYQDGELKIGQLGQTEVFCMADGVMQQERQFLFRMQPATTFRIEDDILIIDIPGGDMRFTRVPVVAGPALYNTSWILDSFSIEGVTQKPMQNSLITLYYEQDTIKGYGGCNWYGADMTADGENISFDSIMQTERACLEEGTMVQESTYMDILRSVASYQYEGEALVLKGDHGNLRFRPVLSAAGLPFAGTEWVLKLFQQEGGLELAPEMDTTLTVQFDETIGEVSGQGGCNHFAGKYDIDGMSIQIEDLVVTDVACEQPVMVQELQYLGYLASARQIIVEARVLTIIHDDGSLVYQLK